MAIPKPPAAYALFITAVKYMSIEYIAFLTYMPACYSLAVQLESSWLSPRFLWNRPGYLKSII
jgi:hypothetical protein